MAKEFYTEKDIEDMWKRGIMSLELSDDIVLTELAYEKANRLGMRLQRPSADNPPSAPVRPYLSTPKPAVPAAALDVSAYLPQVESLVAPKTGDLDLQQRIKNAVMARMGTQVDPKLLDSIIQRVLSTTGMK
ncbi:MAG: hypothetical protein ACYC6H_08515 [Bellilinea sp.]